MQDVLHNLPNSMVPLYNLSFYISYFDHEWCYNKLWPTVRVCNILLKMSTTCSISMFNSFKTVIKQMLTKQQSQWLFILFLLKLISSKIIFNTMGLYVGLTLKILIFVLITEICIFCRKKQFSWKFMINLLFYISFISDKTCI